MIQLFRILILELIYLSIVKSSRNILICPHCFHLLALWCKMFCIFSSKIFLWNLRISSDRLAKILSGFSAATISSNKIQCSCINNNWIFEDHFASLMVHTTIPIIPTNNNHSVNLDCNRGPVSKGLL